MNILRVIASVRAESGGPVEGLRSSGLLMGEMGHRTEVVSLDDPADPQVRGFPLPVHAMGPVRGRALYVPRMARWIVENRERFDVGVIHGLWNAASLAGWRGFRGARLPYALFVHGMLDPWFREAYPLKHWAKQAYWLGGQGWALKDAARVLFTSGEEQRLAQGAFLGPGYRGETVAYGAADCPPRPGEQRADFRAAVPGLGERAYLLFLSRIHPKKGCDMLLEAFARVAAQRPELDLVIAGPDQVGLKAELERQARRLGVLERLHFPGMLAGDAKWGAFRGAEAFVLPSHQENFGIVVAEAMACGTPVLISSKVNIWREAADAGAGFVEDDTTEGTARLLRRFLALSGDERQAMSRAARAGYERHFSAESAARGLAAVLERVVGKNGVRG